MSTKTVHLGPLTFSGSSAPGWTFRDLDDWQGVSPNKIRGEERPLGHGAFPRRRSFRTAKAMSFTARFRGATWIDVEEAFDQLAAVGAEGPVLMSVETGSGTTWRWVTVETSKPQSTRGLPFAWATVDVVADDPLRYADGQWQETGLPVAGQGLTWPVIWPAVWPGGGADGRVLLPNIGKAPTFPRFQLLGGFGSALVTSANSGRRVGLDRPVPIGSVVEINYATRRALLDGISDVSRWLRWREWEPIAGGTTGSFQFDATAPDGTPLMRGKADPAWW